MFVPTASPVVQRQSTWHIGPTTCVVTSRRRARFDSEGSSCSASHPGAPPAQPPATVRARARPRRLAGEATCAVIRSCSTYVRKPPDSAAARCAAVERRREPAFRVRQRHVRLRPRDPSRRPLRPARAARVTERDRHRPDHRHRNHSDTCQRLVRVLPGRGSSQSTSPSSVSSRTTSCRAYRVDVVLPAASAGAPANGTRELDVADVDARATPRVARLLAGRRAASRRRASASSRRGTRALSGARERGRRTSASSGSRP